MKTILNNLFILSLVMITSCSGSTDNVNYPVTRPADIPKNIPHVWTSYDQQAYEDGRIFFNEDSTMMMIKSERPGIDLNNFDSKKLEIVVE